MNIASTRFTPMISLIGYRLKVHSLRGGARAVLLAPTRELALQTHKVVKELSRYTNLRTAVLVGGDSMEAQFAELAANPDIIVATPGAHPQAPLCRTALLSLHSVLCNAVTCKAQLQYIVGRKQARTRSYSNQHHDYTRFSIHASGQ